MQQSRRQFLARSAQLGVLLGAGVPLLEACGGNSSSSSSPKKDPIKDGLKQEAGPLRIVNYADYVNPEVIADFEAKFGVKVEISTITSDSEMLAKLASGALKVDLVHSMADLSIGKLIAAGLIQPLNTSYLTNSGNAMASFTNPWYDPGALYSRPYTLFGSGIGFRADRIDPAQVAEQGWDVLWKATQFKGQVSVIDDNREVFAMSMLHRGSTDVNTVDAKQIDAALADVQQLINDVNVKVNIEGYKNIPEGTTTLAHTWSADMITGAAGYLPEGTKADVLGYWHPPAEQYITSNDSMGVMASAQSPVLAHLYINYMLDATVAEKNFTFTGYLPALGKFSADYLIGQGLVPENLQNCVPTNDDITKGLQLKPLTTAGDALYENAWSKFNAGG